MTIAQKITLGLMGMVAVAMFLVALVSQVKANPSQVYRNNPSIATTTLTYMTPGTATTTNTFNTQGDGGFQADTAVFTQCLNASSTATVLNTTFEYSFDGVTYFQDNLASTTGGVAVSNIVTPASYTWTFASTSVNGAIPNKDFGCKIIAVKTPIEYVRAVQSITGANGAVWSDFGAKRETR